MASKVKDATQYTNVCGHHIGVVRINHLGQGAGIGVAPGSKVWLTEDDEVLTERSFQNPEDNPLENGQLVPSKDVKVEELGTPEAAELVAPEGGAFGPVKPLDDVGTEELGTPEATEAPKPTRSRPAAKK